MTNTLQQTLSDLRGCLTITHRADGSKYTHLSDAACWDAKRDKLQEIIRACHDDEMPNEWRYSMVDHIVNDLLDRCEPDESPWDVEAFRDVSWEVAESGADCYTNENIAWLAGNVGRVSFRDPDVVASMTDDQRSHIGWMTRARQIEEIEWMVQTLLSACDA